MSGYRKSLDYSHTSTFRPFDTLEGTFGNLQLPPASSGFGYVGGFKTSSILKKWGRQEGVMVNIAIQPNYGLLQPPPNLPQRERR